jgi:hypothetical protein
LTVFFDLQQYREELDAKFNADKFKWDKMCHREAAVMLKAFFRELPTSLFPVEYIPAFITLMESRWKRFNVNRTGCKVHKRTGERCMMKCEVMYRFAIC